MEFTKYKEFGDYHWREFEQECDYRKHVLKVMDWVREKKVLDIGCGDGLITSKLGAKGIDTDKEGIRLAKEHKVNVKVGSAYDIKGKYDAVFIGDTLEHLEFPDKAIEAIGRVTKTVYVVVPEDRDDIDYTSWTPEILEQFMTEKGWKQESLDTGNRRIYGKYHNSL